MPSNWFCEIDGRTHGPLSSSELLALASSGRLRPEDPVWSDGTPRGSASRIPGLFQVPEARSTPAVEQKESCTAEGTPPSSIASASRTSGADPDRVGSVAHEVTIPCKFGLKIDGAKRVLSPIDSTLAMSADDTAIVISSSDAETVHVPLTELSVLGEAPDGGMTIGGRARMLSSKRPCVEIANRDLAKVPSILPLTHPASIMAQEILEGHAFMQNVVQGQQSVPAVWTTLGLCVAAYALQTLNLAEATSSIVDFAPADLVRHGGNFLPIILSGEWHRLLVAGFLHTGIMHLLLNLLALYEIGPFCERLLGTRSFVTIYLSALLGSSWISAVAHRDVVVSVGASGAIFGVIGIMVAASARHVIPSLLRKRMFGIAVGFLVCQLYAEAKGLARGGSGIDQIAHGSGFAIGLLGGFFSVARGAEGPVRVPFRRVIAVSGGLLAVVLAAGFVFVPARMTEQRSCLDEGLETLTPKERSLFVQIAAGKNDVATMREAIRTLEGSTNPYVREQRGLMTMIVLMRGEDAADMPSIVAVDELIRETSQCAEAHAAWLGVRAVTDVMKGNMVAAAHAMDEAATVLAQAPAGIQRFALLNLLTELLLIAGFDHHLAAPTVRAWELAVSQNPSRNGDWLPSADIYGSIALSILGRSREAAEALSHIDAGRLDTAQCPAAAVAFLLQSDAKTAKNLARRAIDSGVLAPEAATYLRGIVALPDSDAVSRVRSEVVESPRTDRPDG